MEGGAGGIAPVFNDVVLARDLPEHRLKRGDTVEPVEHHPAPDGTEGSSAEVFNVLGDTLGVEARRRRRPN